jgi:hypothetical protein
MDSVSNMYVTQGRIFALEIPAFRLIITPLGTNLLKEEFGFRDPSWNQESGDYVFQDGTFEHEGVTIPIVWLGFSDRRIVLQVLGNSNAAHAFYGLLGAVLVKMAPGFQEVDPLVFNEETSCIVQLDFDWPALLSPALVTQVSKLAREFSADRTKRVIKGVSIRFTLGAVTTDEQLGEYGIPLFDTTVAVEPKANVPLSERVYFTYSPCDSSTHLRLVSELEARLSGSSARKGRSR